MSFSLFPSQGVAEVHRWIQENRHQFRGEVGSHSCIQPRITIHHPACSFPTLDPSLPLLSLLRCMDPWVWRSAARGLSSPAISRRRSPTRSSTLSSLPGGGVHRQATRSVCDPAKNVSTRESPPQWLDAAAPVRTVRHDEELLSRFLKSRDSRAPPFTVGAKSEGAPSSSAFHGQGPSARRAAQKPPA